jgi:hypothetical protein
MAKYAQYQFGLHDNTSRTVIEQCTHLTAYEEQAIRVSL